MLEVSSKKKGHAVLKLFSNILKTNFGTSASGTVVHPKGYQYTSRPPLSITLFLLAPALTALLLGLLT